jgi:hypothetical protein
MRFEITSESGGGLGAPVEDVAQEAIDATTTAYTNDAGIDVEDHLRAQLSSRGLTATGETIAEIARDIRSGHGVAVGESDGSEDLTGPAAD